MGLAKHFNDFDKDADLKGVGAGAADLALRFLAPGRSRWSLERGASHLADAKLRYLEVTAGSNR